jgi:heptosyltransferase-2
MSLRILIIGPAWVGDMVMAQSLFKLLKQQHPTSAIDVLAPAWTFSLIERMPEVSQAITSPFAHGEFKFKERYQFAKNLRQHAYHQAIVLPHSFKSALIPWLANIPKRTGYLGEYRYKILNDIRRLKKKRYPLMVKQYMALAMQPDEYLPKKWSYPALTLSKKSQTATLNKLKLTISRPILALAAGAAYGYAKCWGESNFAYIANYQLAQGWDIWLFGSEKDRPITEKIMALTNHRCENLAGRLQLPETIDLLSLVNGMVSNDSGLMHIAAALQKPLVALYGPTSPDFTPPLSPNATILQLTLPCQPCFSRTCPLIHHRCMRDLTPDRVLPFIANWK